MSWIYLVIAGLFEVVWATAMKLSNGFSRIDYSIATIVGMILSFFFLAKATKILSLSLAYPVWTGIGAVGSVLIGVLLFKDQLSLMTWVFVILLVISIVGIKITSSH
ncbi:small multidrug resistance protein [Paucilactobacillus hokkaidonensis JCM 18461]|uniref:Small multidrug resistance protein n=2 Tax=Paucilactobacillus hokkaidonensis TaxID=1193095 RepID=A0A0A1GVK1_9LACO|nr:multidrug efflux SMR transporter [Paucilactobacillus hokkaidonensis]KRO09376.1 small multidrug efflux protein [Paucilactobacillus hokkaidonensis]BAP84883.1 small multidrug resistance protein [Paucilactobacillus hokkaidonensis JCM 18461]